MGKASARQAGRAFRSGHGGSQIPTAYRIPQALRAHQFAGAPVAGCATLSRPTVLTWTARHGLSF